MHSFLVDISEPTSQSRWQRFLSLRMTERLMSPAGIIVLLSSAVFFALLVASQGFTMGMMALVVTVALPVVYCIVAFPRFGIVVLLTMAYLLFFIMKAGINFPFGTLMDGLQYMLILSFFIKQKQQPDWGVLKGPLSVVILIWVGYNLFQFGNPAAESRLAWVYTIRTIAEVMLMYFVFVVHIRSLSFVRFLINLWLLLSVFGALYGLKQEFIGFTASEEAWLHSDPAIADLLFIDGHWRKAGIFSDPVAFAYNMIATTMLCIGLLTGPATTGRKIWLITVAALCTWSMLYSGTRGAFVLLPAGIMMFAILKFSMKMIPWLVMAGLAFGFLIVVPTSNGTIRRFQSAFSPNEDESYKLRKYNQKRIQPFMLSHPIGAGLGAAGAWGRRFSPGSFLSSFEVDSGLVRVAVELGWIGLAFFLTFMFLALRTGINNYFSIRDPELKAICFAMVLILFALYIGNFPQEAFVQFPVNIYLYLVIAFIVITKQLDDANNEAGKELFKKGMNGRSANLK